MDFLRQFSQARKVSTPLVAVRTPDPIATITHLCSTIQIDKMPLLEWNVVEGLSGLNDRGDTAANAMGGNGIGIGNLAKTLVSAKSLPEEAVLFVHNAQNFLTDSMVKQAICNLRDLYKSNGRTLVLLGPDFSFSAELSGDMLLLDEPLPDAARIESITKSVFHSAGLPEPDAQTIAKATDAVVGLAGFPAEQSLAESLTPKGLNFNDLWERKRQKIEQVPGLSIWRGNESFAGIGGCTNAKGFLQMLLTGKRPARAVIFVDEIEKAMAGANSDSSGVAQDFLGTLLAYMQNSRARGLLFVGPPGAAKSALAKAAGNFSGIPTISFDLGGMKGSLVGESEQRLRTALKVVDSVSQGEALFIATSNNIGSLPPELRRRFKRGTFFFDLPNAEERREIWNIYLKKYDALGTYEDVPLPDDTDWTGAEIEQCAEMAWELDCSLRDAANYIVPVAKSAAEQINRLRQEAAGKYISASNPGPYLLQRDTTDEPKRRLRVGADTAGV